VGKGGAIKEKVKEAIHEAEITETLGEVEIAPEDLIVIIGDDREILSAIHELGERSNPILAVSREPTRGFLAQVTLPELGHALRSILRGSYKIEENTRLSVHLDNKSLFAVNETAVFSRRSATLLKYNLIIDDEVMWSDFADGVIVSTPLGSSAYSLSAGGPYIHHLARVFSIVPVNSIDTTRRPLIVSDSSRIVIDGVESRSRPELVIDGVYRIPLRRSLTLSRCETPLNFIRLQPTSMIVHRIERKIQLAEELMKIPPSAKLIMKMLELEGPMTYRELVEKSMLPERTIRQALSTLLYKQLIKKRTLPRDNRQKIYCIASQEGKSGTADRG